MGEGVPYVDGPPSPTYAGIDVDDRHGPTSCFYFITNHVWTNRSAPVRSRDAANVENDVLGLGVDHLLHFA